jgi:CheY-like chemotaxis protein
MAAFPLTVDGRPSGVLVLFADVPGHFDDVECRLLDELATDVSFALQYLEREEKRKQVPVRLQESEAGLRRAQLMNKTGHAAQVIISDQRMSGMSGSEFLSIANLSPVPSVFRGSMSRPLAGRTAASGTRITITTPSEVAPMAGASTTLS